ncbi:MAG: hypothetical protein ACR2JM_06145 [Mycobacterium sp.]
MNAANRLSNATQESPIPAMLALMATMAMQLAIPKKYTAVPRWPLILLEVLLIIGLLALRSGHSTRHPALGRKVRLVLLAAITVDNTASAILLDWHILTGMMANKASVLIGSGAAIFVTNVLVFGMWYWELDRGGPLARANNERPYPDFMFPQLANPELAPEDWAPTFVDYLYVSVTNVMAFSPTDTMPLSRGAKALMTLQAFVAVSTLALVFARAVNVLS